AAEMLGDDIPPQKKRDDIPIRPFLAIIGTIGIGKTTLARKIRVWDDGWRIVQKATLSAFFIAHCIQRDLHKMNTLLKVEELEDNNPILEEIHRLTVQKIEMKTSIVEDANLKFLAINGSNLSTHIGHEIRGTLDDG
ncbi:hypothetical protein ACJX0J_032098, partial [Zea mays]